MRGRPAEGDYTRTGVEYLRKHRVRLLPDHVLTTASYLVAELQKCEQMIQSLKEADPQSVDSAVRQQKLYWQTRAVAIADMVATVHEPMGRQRWLAAVAMVEQAAHEAGLSTSPDPDCDDDPEPPAARAA